ncbi:PTS fructose transporter subunit EIIBC [Candidatus Tokpelaia sp.]|nr:PTS fructose transporter subunit EIIBC [Candidatus Tokpelaia sp.]
MMKLFAVIDEADAPVLAILAQEMLLHAAGEKGFEIEIYRRNGSAVPNISPAWQNGDIMLLVGSRQGEENKPAWAAGFSGPIIAATREDIFNRSAALWRQIEQAAGKSAAAPGERAIKDAGGRAAIDGSAAIGGNPSVPHKGETAARKVQKLVAVTSCPTGIAHTFMAAEALMTGAKALGLTIRVETQGSVGAGTPLSEEEISAADLVIIAADREVERSRFNGKYVYSSGTKAAIANGKAYIQTAIDRAERQNAGSNPGAAAQAAGGQKGKNGFYAPLMTGVSFMLPFVVAGGLLIALGLALGGVNVEEQNGSFAHILWQIGARNVFPLIVPVLAGYIAFAIGDRPALAPGMVGGFVSDQIGAGFIGGIIAGFLAGYISRAAAHYIRLPRTIEGLKPVLILPLLCTAATGLILFYVIQAPTTALLHMLTDWVRGLEAQSNGAIINALLLGALIGGMMAVDMGGPVNKAAYTVAIGLLSVKIYTPMAAAMLGGMTPPMALALACYMRPRCFTTKERESSAATFIMGLSFISEGAIPFATRDPLRVIPCLIIGSAFAGAVALLAGTGIIVPHGGIFLLPIKGAIINYGGYFMALVSGAIVSACCLCLICRPLPKEQNQPPAVKRANGL